MWLLLYITLWYYSFVLFFFAVYYFLCTTHIQFIKFLSFFLLFFIKQTVAGFSKASAKTIDVPAVVEADEVAAANAIDSSVDTPATPPVNDWRNIAEERKARAAEGEALGPLGKLFQMTGQKMVIENVVEDATSTSSSSEEVAVEGAAVESASTDSQR